jgi:hypothetical protein
VMRPFYLSSALLSSTPFRLTLLHPASLRCAQGERNALGEGAAAF